MIERVVCPYCGEDIYVDTDDWCDEDEVYEYQCEECGKYCIVSASVSWSYDAEKLNCKNGLAEHKYEYFPGHTIRRCKVCGEVEEGGREMKTYFIDGNSMHLAGSQIDVSDNFFGSESPKSDATDSQRQDAIRFWLSEGWMDDGDVVVWDGVRYIVGEGDNNGQA